MRSADRNASGSLLSIKRDRRPVDFPIRKAFGDETELSRLPQKPQTPRGIISSYRDVSGLKLLRRIGSLEHLFDCDLIFLVNVKPRNVPRGEDKPTAHRPVAMGQIRNELPANMANPEPRLNIADGDDVRVCDRENNR